MDAEQITQIPEVYAARNIIAALRERGRKVSDCEAVKTTYVDRRPRFRYCGKCPMCLVWKAVAQYEEVGE
jgi:hypothetical protein